MPRLTFLLKPLAVAFMVASITPLVHAQVTFGDYAGAATINHNQGSRFDPPETTTSISTTSAYSTTSLSITPSQVTATFLQGTLASDFTDGYSGIDFTAKDGTTYSFIDNPAVFSGDPRVNEYDWFAGLLDPTGQDWLFQDSSGALYGSPTGVLLAGRTYELFWSADIIPVSDPSLTYVSTVSFNAPSAPAATPEPSSLVLLCTGLAGTAAAFRRRFDA